MTSSQLEHMTNINANNEQDEARNSIRRRCFLTPGANAALSAWAKRNVQRPFPKEATKIELARKNHLTYNQVADWFRNYRRRRWPADHAKFLAKSVQALQSKL